jgi:hypothetical protein
MSMPAHLNQRRAFVPSFRRAPAMDLRLQLLLVLALLIAVLAFETAHAEEAVEESLNDGTITTTTNTVTTKTVKRGAPAATATPDENKAAKPEDFIVTSTFGSLTGQGMHGCKSEALSKDAVKELKTECSAWMKERKAELKAKYQTGTCQEECNDCGMGLKRCAVNGVVHYRP